HKNTHTFPTRRSSDLDAGTRTIWLLLTGNPGKTNETQILDDAGQGRRTVWVTHSNDDGATWAAPIEITSSVKEKNWTWYATGPRSEEHTSELQSRSDL